MPRAPIERTRRIVGCARVILSDVHELRRPSGGTRSRIRWFLRGVQKSIGPLWPMHKRARGVPVKEEELTTQEGMFLVLPVPFRVLDGRVLVEAQAANGLGRWAENFFPDYRGCANHLGEPDPKTLGICLARIRFTRALRQDRLSSTSINIRANCVSEKRASNSKDIGSFHKSIEVSSVCTLRII
jgi:hypothetical protein